MYKTKEEQENFINHLRYLLSLCRQTRYKRNDWQQLKAILTQAGHWRRRYQPTLEQKIQKKRSSKTVWKERYGQHGEE